MEQRQHCYRNHRHRWYSNGYRPWHNGHHLYLAHNLSDYYQHNRERASGSHCRHLQCLRISEHHTHRCHYGRHLEQLQPRLRQCAGRGHNGHCHRCFVYRRHHQYCVHHAIRLYCYRSGNCKRIVADTGYEKSMQRPDNSPF